MNYIKYVSHVYFFQNVWNIYENSYKAFLELKKKMFVTKLAYWYTSFSKRYCI